jgi:hypothetical protein
MLPVPRVLLVGAGQMIFALIDCLREQDCLPLTGEALPCPQCCPLQASK